jgi:hypothetical protein
MAACAAAARCGGYAAFMADAVVWRLFLQPRITLLGEPVEFVVLLIDPVRDALLVLLARRAGGLLDQLPDVILKDRDPIVEFGQ